MSNDNGAAGSISQVDGGVRGAEAGALRPSQAPGAMGGPQAAAWSEGNHPVSPQSSAAAPMPTSASPIGFSCSLTHDQVSQCVKARALKFAQSRGIALPTDEADFIQRAKIHWGADGSAAVTLEV
jgi:hypothetical protein